MIREDWKSVMRALDATSLARWRADPIAFIEHTLRDPETGKPFVLSEAERDFFKFAFKLDDNGRLKFPSWYSAPSRRVGKTTLAAIIMLTMILLYGGRFAEGYCVANDLEQAQCRVFAIVKRIIEASPLLRGIAKLTADRVIFPALGATIIAIASPTPPGPPVPTLSSPASTSFGASPRSAVGACGTR